MTKDLPIVLKAEVGNHSSQQMGQLGGESLPQDRGGQDLNDEEKRKVLTPSDFFFFKTGKAH